MALRATAYNWRSKLTQIGRNRSFATATNEPRSSSNPLMKGEYFPIYIVGGMVAVAVVMAIHSAKQQLVHHPGVSPSKKRRASLAEAEIPDKAAANADKFVNKSFLRKVAHIQNDKDTVPSQYPIPYTKDRNTDNLKSSAGKRA